MRGRSGIRTNAVAPGPLVTDRLVDRGIREEQIDSLFRNVLPLQRVARTEYLGAAILFLASDLASFINGVILPVEGGLRTYAPELKTFIDASWLGRADASKQEEERSVTPRT